jgi:hypothetical protein
MSCSLCTCKCVEERRKEETYVRARARLAGHGVARQWARAHDVRVNGPPKSSPKPRRPTASFYHLFFIMSPCLIHF